MQTNTLNTIRNLSQAAREMFAEILFHGEMVRRDRFEGMHGWDELTENDLVNCWEDDLGVEFCAIGTQA